MSHNNDLWPVCHQTDWILLPSESCHSTMTFDLSATRLIGYCCLLNHVTQQWPLTCMPPDWLDIAAFWFMSHNNELWPVHLQTDWILPPSESCHTLTCLPRNKSTPEYMHYTASLSTARCIFSYKYLSQTAKSYWAVERFGESARWADPTIRLVVKANSIVEKARWAHFSPSHLNKPKPLGETLMWWRVLRSAHLAVYPSMQFAFLVRISVWNGKIKQSSEAYRRECEMDWSHVSWWKQGCYI